MIGNYYGGSYEYSFIVEFESSGHQEGEPPKTAYMKPGAVLDVNDLPGTLVRYGYDLEGWSSTGEEQDIPDGGEITIESNLTLKAVWKEKDSYEVGDRGPTGGWIFQVNGTTYFEATPADNEITSDWDDAIKFADELEIFSDDEDWKLPGKNELDEMYEKLFEEGLGDFAEARYWSSDEEGDDAWTVHFGEEGNHYDLLKTNKYRVRPFRDFIL